MSVVPSNEATLRSGLYAIVDVTSLAERALDPVAFTAAVLEARPAALQLRAKSLPDADVVELLKALSPLCQHAAVPLVANDRVDLAVAAGCTYVHVGQGDTPLETVRRVAPALRVGVSTHTEEQLVAALASRPDYVAYGPVFPTVSKVDPDPCVGLDGLERASARATAVGVPLVAIGGVSLSRAPLVRPWATASAVIQALLPDAALSGPARYEEVAARARALQQELVHAPLEREGRRA
jgi:thiamine-phosphate pyrophosphorylase